MTEFEKNEIPSEGKKISVNPIVSKVASLYERLRNAMDYRDEEVILRAAIERILKRRFLFQRSGKKIAEPLIRELVWARYFDDESLSEKTIEKAQKTIDLYLELREKVLLKYPMLKESEINELMYHLMSSSIEHFLGNPRKKEVMTNFMYAVASKSIDITDEEEKTKNVQVFIAVHKAFAKDDIALLRFHLFKQIFGELTAENLDKTAAIFLEGYKEIQRQLSYPRKDRIYNYVKDKTAIFFILEDLFNLPKEKFREIIKNDEEFKGAVFEICKNRYKGISSKVRRAIVRSIIFILLTKAFFAMAIEGTYESIFYGRILWTSTILNIAVPPFLMAFVGVFIKGPSIDNSERIYSYIKHILTEKNPLFSSSLIIKRNPQKANPIFMLLWFISFVLAFGITIYLLLSLNYNILSLLVFLFFLAIVSFLTYRISQSANAYSVEKKKNFTTTISDFLFMPFVRVGRHLTEGISQLNLFLFVFDFIIETPFKGLFAFFEQWFFFLQAKREELE